MTDVSDPTHPRFCISHSRGCRGKGISPPVFVVQEVDIKGVYLRNMWALEFERDVLLKEIIYGTLPDGYREKMKAIPLQVNRFYSIQGGVYFFRLVYVGGKVVPEIFSHENFHLKSDSGLLN
ncbi:MAG: hypothetical protein AB9866_16135 [Syntrophobacteraceae bacterium]